MKLYNELKEKYKDINKIILDKNIFGIIRGITIKYKDGQEVNFPGSDEKFLTLYFDIESETDVEKISKKIYYTSDNIAKVEVIKRDSNFFPALSRIYLEDGRSFIYEPKFFSVYNCVKRNETDLDKYLFESLMIKYQCNKEELDRLIDHDVYVKAYLSDRDRNAKGTNEIVNRFISDNTSKKKTNDVVVSVEKYKKIDIVSFNREGFPSTLIIYYDDNSSVLVSNESACYKFLKNALNKGLDQCNYYPNSKEKGIARVSFFMENFDEKLRVKRKKTNNLFAIFKDEKKFKF